MLSCHGLKKTPPTHSVAVKYLSCQHRHREIERLPFVQDSDNLQSWNRYSYVLNNPLSYTDPSGFFFSKIFKAIGQALGKLFKTIGNAFKSLLRNPIVRSILQIVACGFGVPACVAASGALTALAGGSLEESLKAAAFAWISAGVWDTVGQFMDTLTNLTVSARLSASMRSFIFCYSPFLIFR